jgi:hypothetical protein
MGVIPPEEVEFVERAANYLENPGFVVKLADLFGVPMEGLLAIAPGKFAKAVHLALLRALDVALFSLTRSVRPATSFRSCEGKAWWAGYRHTATTAMAGGAAGLFGTPGLVLELPISTCVMLRSIGAIARQYGEDLREAPVRLECLSLFATGGPTSADDDMDASWLTVRASLDSLVKHAARYVAHTPATEIVTSIRNGTAPALIKLISKISGSYETAVAEKLMAQTVPVIGAVGGATVNVLFTEHFNAVARYHFGLRNLQRRWGTEVIEAIYAEAAASVRQQGRPPLAGSGAAVRDPASLLPARKPR